MPTFHTLDDAGPARRLGRCRIADRPEPGQVLADGCEGFDPRFADDKKKVLQPFSTGPRNCLGMK